MMSNCTGWMKSWWRRKSYSNSTYAAQPRSLPRVLPLVQYKLTDNGLTSLRRHKPSSRLRQQNDGLNKMPSITAACMSMITLQTGVNTGPRRIVGASLKKDEQFFDEFDRNRPSCLSICMSG